MREHYMAPGVAEYPNIYVAWDFDACTMLVNGFCIPRLSDPPSAEPVPSSLNLRARTSRTNVFMPSERLESNHGAN